MGLSEKHACSPETIIFITGKAKQVKYLQKLGKALMLPVSVMPICGLLMGLGYLLCPAAMQDEVVVVSGVPAQIGYFLIQAGGALINHIAWLFAIGFGIGMSEDNDGVGAIAGLVSWLIITTLLSVGTIKTLFPSAADDSSQILAFKKIENPFIGILAGIIGSVCYNRFHKTRLPNWLSFFSGKRAVAIVAGGVSVAASLLLLVIWPLIFSGLTALGRGIEQLGPAGAGLYAFLNRLLIPFGLHHALNNVFWFDIIGLGDLTHFWAGHTSADVSWSLGMYMSGFFPCMMFGIPAAALAMYQNAKPERRKAAMGILVSSAVCAFVCGVTEPFEFSFMFLSPVLYGVYALLYGIFSWLTVVIGFRAGFCFSAGAVDLIFSIPMPAAAKLWLIFPLGLLAFAVFYGVFRFMIVKWNLKTPGREDDLPAQPAAVAASSAGENRYAAMAQTILQGLGGPGNLLSVDNCITRLRLEIRDMSRVDDGVIRSSGAAGIIRPGKNALQVVIGPTVQFVADELKRLCQTQSSLDQYMAEKGLRSPAEGEMIPMEDIPDPVFSDGIMGPCVGIMPDSGTIRAPIGGTVSAVAAACHAVSVQGEGKEILVHVGLNTVQLNGEGFRVLVHEGEEVKQGQPLMEADLALIRERGFNPMVIVVRVTDESGETTE